MKQLLMGCLLCLFFLTINAQNIVVNELMTKNTATISDFEGEFEDWIELYNSGNTSINLEGFALSDDDDEPLKWLFPNVSIDAGAFLVLFASDKDTIVDGEIHTNFKLKAEGEPLLLSDASGDLIDLIEKQLLFENQSFGRIEDGEEDFNSFVISSPGASNENNSTEFEIEFSQDAGQYTDEFELTLSVATGVELRYTTDGNIPDMDSPLYNNGIDIESREGEPNTISTIQVTDDDLAYEPIGEVYKINTIRVRAFYDDVPVSRVHTRSYIIDEDTERYTLPIISLTTAPDNFFDDSTGIYVPGANYDGSDENTMNAFQRGEEWERPVHFEYFDEDGELIVDQDAGVRIHGGGSRRDRQKSLRLYARSEYGASRFEYSFFEDKDIDEYKRLVLRSQPAANSSFMTDEVTSRLLSTTDLGYMATKETIVFLNGEFWGVYHIRERMDKYYLEDNYGVDKDEVNFLEGDPLTAGCCIEGESTEYLEMIDYIGDNDITDPAVYASIQSMMDVENYMDYLIAEFYVANYDWPQNNIRYWKTTDSDGKWQWLLYDVDFGLRYDDRPSITNFFNNESINTAEWATYLAQQLVQNDLFKSRFVQKFEEHLNTTFSQESVADAVNGIKSKIAPHMQESFDRYANETALDTWEERVDRIVDDYALLRPCFLQEQIIEQFEEVINAAGCEGEEEDDILDIGVVAITSPSATTMEGEQEINISILNFGNIEIEEALIDWSINGEAQEMYTYNDDLLEGQSDNITLDTYYFEAGNTYEIEVTISEPNGAVEDEEMDNNTFSKTIEVVEDLTIEEPTEESTIEITEPTEEPTTEITEQTTSTPEDTVDIAIIAITEPFDGMDEGLHIIAITMTNVGNVPVETVDITTTINGVPIQAYYYSAPTLDPGESFNVSINNHFFEAGEIYVVEVTLSDPNGEDDFDMNDNTLSATIIAVPADEILDIGIISLTNPDTNIEEGTHTLDILLRNFGTATVETAAIEIKINDELQLPYYYTGPALEEGESEEIMIGSYFFEEGEEYDIEIIVSDPNGMMDENTLNNRISETIMVEMSDCAANAEDDFYMTAGSLMTLDVTENDEELDDFYMCGFSLPENGTVVEDDGMLLYMPNIDFIGTDDFEYYMCNGDECGPMEVVGKVHIEVNAAECVQEDVTITCTPAYTDAVLCPEFCLFDGTTNVDPNYQLVGARSFFTSCTIAFIDDHCLRYTPLPGMEAYSGYDEIEVYACNNDGVCDTIYYMMAIGDCDEERLDLIDGNRLSLVAYPNPSYGLFNLIIPETEIESHQILVYNVEGKLMEEHTVVPEYIIPNYQIDLRNEAKGIYFIHWVNGENSEVLKVLVE